ncbi:hypothetical protein JKP88DRAFT_262844 [Tribonema minus]|uniref:Calcineurin-like phosphoesterase domain-containing protein n=1 Tax=Tribonema minus TaxID=303371 RepID=A0A836CHZ6_9STRA|nr:hypothetical protein JKP88DRAFT_262844 [Tribonema minus]
MTAHQRCATSLQAVTTRRALLSQAVAFLAVPALALAEGYEDLSADDAPEPVRETLTDEERIKRKLEAQAKATGKGSSGRQSYQSQLRLRPHSHSCRSAARCIHGGRHALMMADQQGWQEGVRVKIISSGESGVIREKRGRGWWTVALDDKDAVASVTTRASNLALSGADKAAAQGGTDLAAAPAAPQQQDHLPVQKALDAQADSASDGTATTAHVSSSGAAEDNTTTRRSSTRRKPPSTTTAAPLPPPAPPDTPALVTLDDPTLPHRAVTQWVVFSDLHVGVGSLSVCMEVLDRVRAEAEARPGAGVLFLGDFWHLRGTLRVDLLNAVLARLAAWRAPVVLLPGNHDQCQKQVVGTCLCTTPAGAEHSLTPLRYAFRPGHAVVISQPTLFLGALWLPHCRDQRALERVLALPAAAAARAVFCHVDARGAAMNDGIYSRTGISPSAFPAGARVYSGHFHRPHSVGGGRVRYVGSPYQTSLAEAGQRKELLILDAADWSVRDAVEICVGRRFFRAEGEGQKTITAHVSHVAAALIIICPSAVPRRCAPQPLPSAADARRGDRLVWSVPDVRAAAVQDASAALRSAGVEVELRSMPRMRAAAAADAEQPSAAAALLDGGVLPRAGGAAALPPDALTPPSLLDKYLAAEAAAGRPARADVRAAAEAAVRALCSGAALSSSSSSSSAQASNAAADMSSSIGSSSAVVGNGGGSGGAAPAPARHAALDLEEVRLARFGPFRNAAAYPLRGRGVVLLRGSNRDDLAADSNGAGKTTLAAAALWALTGSLDTRPTSDARAQDVVYDMDGSSGGGGGGDDGSAPRRGSGGVAEVTLTATLNGEKLVVTRRKGARTSQLRVTHGGRDLTRQALRDTQAVLERDLGLRAEVLRRTLFQGQHHMYGERLERVRGDPGLLESTDARFKEELSLLMPMDFWQDAARSARRAAADAEREGDVRAAEAALRTGDLAARQQQRDALARELAARRQACGAAAAADDSYHAPPPPPAAAVAAAAGRVEAARAIVAQAATDIAAAEDALREARRRADAVAARRGGGVAPAQAEVHRLEERRRFARRWWRQVLLLLLLLLCARKLCRGGRSGVRQCALSTLVHASIDTTTGHIADHRRALHRPRVTHLCRDADAARAAAEALRGELSALRAAAAEAAAGDADADSARAALDAAARIAQDTAAAEAVARAAHAAAAEHLSTHRKAAARSASGGSGGGSGGGSSGGVSVCTSCGQPITPEFAAAREASLAAAANAAAEVVTQAAGAAAAAARAAAAAETALATAQRRSALAGRAADAEAAAAAAERAAGDRARELGGVEDDLRMAQQALEAAKTAADHDAQAAASAVTAAEWVASAHRDKQEMAQREFASAVELQSQFVLASQERERQAKDLADAVETAARALSDCDAAVQRLSGEAQQLRGAAEAAAQRKSAYAAAAEHLGVREHEMQSFACPLMRTLFTAYQTAKARRCDAAGVLALRSHQPPHRTRRRRRRAPQNFVFREGVEQLEAFAACFLDALSDGGLQLSLNLDGERVIKRAEVIGSDGQRRERSLSQLSGGQWRRVSLSLELAFAELARQRCGLACNVVVLDEVLSQLDANGRARVAQLLRHLSAEMHYRGLLHPTHTDIGHPIHRLCFLLIRNGGHSSRRLVSSAAAQLDANGRARVAHLLRRLVAADGGYSTVLVILQDLPAEQIIDSFDAVDEVVKRGDRSWLSCCSCHQRFDND